MLLQVQRRRLAGAEEVGDVLHLYEGHRGGLELDTGRREGEVDEPILRIIWLGGWPAGSVAVLRNNTYLQRTTPSFKETSKSPGGRRSPSTLSIHDRISSAAAGVYLSRRILRRSLSRDVTEAMVVGCLVSQRRLFCLWFVIVMRLGASGDYRGEGSRHQLAGISQQSDRLRSWNSS